MIVGQQIGPFSVEKELGSGAMGSVYRARYTKTGQRVAIKIIAPGLAGSDKAMDRFKREAEILKQLKHPNIVRLYAHGKFHGTPFYAMEYIDGESLDHVMARRGRISWEEVAAMGQQLCSALQHAHEQGIIHRDLKPSNLMMLPDGTLKLTDFGIAKDLDGTQLTSANCTVGTAAYMSPEQCRGERDLTHKSDLYSLGVLFYELITGHKPFRAETPMDMFLMHVQGQVERPSREVLDLPVWFDTLICQLLEKKPEQRPLNAAAVAEALNRILEKVEAQQSVGMEAVRGKLADRSLQRMELDEHDRAAARTLLGKKKKRRKPKQGVPFYYQVWFKGACLVVALGGIVYLIYLIARPPSPETLYARARKVMASFDEMQEKAATLDPAAWDQAKKLAEDNREDWADARSGSIKDFLKYSKNRDDDEAKQMRHWADQLDVFDRERQLLIWIRRQTSVDNDAEGLARAAVEQERTGRLVEAQKNWQSLRKYKEGEDSRLRVWGLLAEKRLRDLQRVFDLARHLDRKLSRTRKQLAPSPPSGSFEEQAERALRFETFGDGDRAHELWHQLAGRFEKNDARRPWFLLAAQGQLRNPKVQEPEKARKDLIGKQLKEAAKLVERKKPDQAKELYQDIHTLYKEDEGETGKLAAEARKQLEQLTRKTAP
jgi:serine/threonine-protein kinase